MSKGIERNKRSARTESLNARAPHRTKAALATRGAPVIFQALTRLPYGSGTSQSGRCGQLQGTDGNTRGLKFVSTGGVAHGPAELTGQTFPSAPPKSPGCARPTRGSA